MNTLLEKDPVVFDETILDEVLPCVRCQGEAAWRVENRCCARFGFGCTPCKTAWEAHVRAVFVLGAAFGNSPTCTTCRTPHDTFEEAFEVRAV